jgi:alkane 1-monooxygenase
MCLIAVFMSLFAYYCAGWKGVAFHLMICTLTKVALEILNYVEHYGLVRNPNCPVQPRHSWNCNHVVSGVISYNLTRHSHHHADAQLHYQHLLTHSDQPEIPNGLMTAYLTALIPPLWRKMIVPKLLEWDQQQAVKEEYELIRQANNKSGWDELKSENASPDLLEV